MADGSDEQTCDEMARNRAWDIDGRASYPEQRDTQPASKQSSKQADTRQQRGKETSGNLAGATEGRAQVKQLLCFSFRVGRAHRLLFSLHRSLAVH